MQSGIARDHSVQYPVALKGSKGQRLQVGRRDDEWPEWFWCTAADGSAGWVPEALLELRGSEALLTRDYETTELAVSAGERVTIHEELAGWVWVTNEREQSGWIPARCLTNS